MMTKKLQSSASEKKSSKGSDGPKRSRLSQATHKFWSTIADRVNIIFRALGLAIIVSAFQSLRHPFGKGLEEHIKIALHKNRSTALLRALIHFVPVGVALWEITLNINTYYVGSSALNLVYYQFAAKAHEMMIHASLAAIVLSYVRHEMTLGNGLPFGALFSSLAINQVSYLWSMEFLGSAGSKHLPLGRKLAMVSIISLCFIIAVAAGPSSAILLVPRLDYWSAGSTNIWLNATSNDIWPDRLEGWSVPENCAESKEFTTSNECPSSEWQFIQQFGLMMDNSVPMDIAETTRTLGGTQPLSCELSGKTSYRQFRAAGMELKGDLPLVGPLFQAAFMSTTQQAVIADALGVTANLWDQSIEFAHPGGSHGSIPFDHQSAAHSISTGYFQPYSVATCIRDLVLGADDQRPISFPITAGIDYGNEPSYLNHVNSSASREASYLGHSNILQIPAIEYPQIIRSQLFELPGSKSSTRVKWVELPSDLFAGSSIGAVILRPSRPSNPQDSTQHSTVSDMFVCNVAAGWGSSILNATTFIGSTSAVSSLVKSYETAGTKEVGDLGDLPQGAPNSFQQTTNVDLDFLLPHFPSKAVEISQEWAEYLNPWIPSLNSTVIDFLTKDTSENQTTVQLSELFGEHLLSSLVTNGLARVGINSQLQGSLKLTPERDPDGDLWYSGKGDVFTVDPNQSKDWVKLRVNSVLKGYAYNCNATPPKVAVAFLMTYCVLALSHCFYSGISGISSTCWDSIAEVTALAINSTPTTALRNTCAGISEIRIFKVPVRILAMRDLEGDGEHLELVFGDVNAEQARKMSIKSNRKYGTMPVIASAPSEEQHHLKKL